MKAKETFAKAEYTCKELGLQLAMPNSIAENDEPRFQKRNLITDNLSVYITVYKIVHLDLKLLVREILCASKSYILYTFRAIQSLSNVSKSLV